MMNKIPHKEDMSHGLRKQIFDVPEVSIREIVANALIYAFIPSAHGTHDGTRRIKGLDAIPCLKGINALIYQDLTINGDGPIIEIFSDKIKITNPGKPLIDTDRFIDSPSKSRNTKLGTLIKRLGLCKERGSGIDRALTEIENAALPAPLFQTVEASTVVTIYMRRNFPDISKEDRIRACYQHACLCFEKSEFMSNASLRHRFRLSDKQYSQVSLVIIDTIDRCEIRPLEEDQAKRNARYVPYWA